MLAFAETLEIEYKAAGIDVCTVRLVIGCKLALGKGKIRGHLPKEYLSQALTAVEIFNVSMSMMEHSYSCHGPT